MSTAELIAISGAIAAILGALIGMLGTVLTTWINKHYEDKRSRRELSIKTALEYWTKAFEVAQKAQAPVAPMEAFTFHAINVMRLAQRENLSEDQLRDELKKIRKLTDMITADAFEPRPPPKT